MSDNCGVCTRDIPEGRSGAETRAGAVALITLATMVTEVLFGILSGSMALLADGIHMGTHAVALLITVVAYRMARRLRSHPAFSFGTGKVGALGGYTNAILLGVTALVMIYESVDRLIHPQPIRFDEAIIVAVVGLGINSACALILRGGRGRGEHDHGHEHRPGHDHGHTDANLRAALVHVLADALTSVLAITALFAGKYLQWSFLDPAVGILGALLIIRWGWGLLRETGGLLLDFGDYREEAARIRRILEAQGSTVRDLHIWRYSENGRSLMLTVCDPKGRSSEEIRALLGDIEEFSHVTVEVCGG